MVEVSHEEVQPQLGEAQPGRHVEIPHSLPAAGQGVQLTRVVAVVIFLRNGFQLIYIQIVLWIRIGFNADPGLAFNLNEDPDPDPGKQTNADPCGSGILVRI